MSSFDDHYHYTKNQELVVNVVAPMCYTRGKGLKGIFMICEDFDGAIKEDWLELAERERLFLFIIKLSFGDICEDVTEGIKQYYESRTSWKGGGFGLLSAYRYLIGIGKGCHVARLVLEKIGNSIAKTYLCQTIEAFSIQKAWSELRLYRKVILNSHDSLVEYVRDMRHLQKWEEKYCGVMREWYTYIPEKARTSKLPVVIALHGITSNGEKFTEQTQWDILAEKYQFILIAPTGYLNRWNVSKSELYPSEVDFIKHILRRTEDKCEVDYERIYLMGFSMGAAMADRLQCEEPFLFAATALFSGQLFNINDDELALLSGQTDRTDYYKHIRSDIPRNVWMFYGEEESDCDYPGSRKQALQFWLKNNQIDRNSVIHLWDHNQINTIVYQGTYFNIRMVGQTSVGHAYHPELMEMVYLDLFQKSKRSNNSIKDVVVQADLMRIEFTDAIPIAVLITSKSGFDFEPICVDVNQSVTEVILQDRFPESDFWLLPIYQSGTANKPYQYKRS